mgnify:CR=1 FL=1
MSQNRNKLIQLLTGNLVNLVVHQVLEESAQEEMLRKHYDKESSVSFEVAKKYREKINPAQREFPERDLSKIREEVLKRSSNEPNLRISKGYEGIDLNLINPILERVLKELVIEE